MSMLVDCAVIVRVFENDGWRASPPYHPACRVQNTTTRACLDHSRRHPQYYATPSSWSSRAMLRMASPSSQRRTRALQCVCDGPPGHLQLFRSSARLAMRTAATLASSGYGVAVVTPRHHRTLLHSDAISITFDKSVCAASLSAFASTYLNLSVDTTV